MPELLTVQALDEPEPQHMILTPGGACCPSCGAGHEAGDWQCQYCRNPVKPEAWSA